MRAVAIAIIFMTWIVGMAMLGVSIGSGIAILLGAPPIAGQIIGATFAVGFGIWPARIHVNMRWRPELTWKWYDLIPFVTFFRRETYRSESILTAFFFLMALLFSVAAGMAVEFIIRDILQAKPNHDLIRSAAVGWVIIALGAHVVLTRGILDRRTSAE